jgi:dynein heavy chain
MKRLV